jgi:hypothetical protein
MHLADCLPVRIESADPTEQGLALPVLQRLGSQRTRPDGYGVPETARAANHQCSLTAEPIHSREHLCPRISWQPLNQLIEGAGHQAGHFVANERVNAGNIRLWHNILPFRHYTPLASRWECGSEMTPPHSTQRTLPAFCSSTETQYEIMRLCVQAQGRLIGSGCTACSDTVKFTIHFRVTVGFSFRLVWRSYSRTLVKALSTRTGFSCQIDTTSNVVVVRQQGKEVLRVLRRSRRRQ